MLDTYFVSARILYKKYGEAPARVVRESGPGEHEHRGYYDRLGHIYTAPRRTSGMLRSKPGATPRPGHERRRVSRGHLREHREFAPLVPIAVANFDKDVRCEETVAIVHEPIRLSDHLGEAPGDRSLCRLVNGYVREAVRLAR